MITQMTDREPFSIIVELEDGALELVTDVMRIYSPPDRYPNLLEIIDDGEDAPPDDNSAQDWIDCPIEPADIYAIKTRIEEHGFCDVRLFSIDGKIKRAIRYIAPSGDDPGRDDLYFEDGTLLSTAYFKRRHNLPPDRTLTEWSVYGFGVRR